MDKISQNSDIINSEQSADQELVHLVRKCLELLHSFGSLLGSITSVPGEVELKSLKGHIVGYGDFMKLMDTNYRAYLFLGKIIVYKTSSSNCRIFSFKENVSCKKLDSALATYDYLKTSKPRRLYKKETEIHRASEGPKIPSSGSPAIVPDYDPSLAVYIAYVDLRKRLDSFIHWPDDHVQSPQELAVAGFFHTGDGDYLRCHYCRLGVRNWDPDDRPLDEHVRRRPSCGYLHAHFGEDFIAKTKARLQSRGPVFTNHESREAPGAGGPEGAIPPPRCPADPSATSPRVIPTNNDNAPERNTEEEESSDDTLLDMMGTTRPAASERIAGERCRPPLDPVQSAPDPPVDLLAARSQRDADEVSSLFAGSSSTGSKTCETEFEGDQDGTGRNFTLLDLEKIYALRFPLGPNIRIPATNCEQTNSEPPEFSNKGHDGKADASSHETDNVSHSQTTNPEASRDKDNDVNKACGKRSANIHETAEVTSSVQDVLRDMQAIWEARKKFVYSPLSQLYVCPIFPRNFEEGLARVDFRSFDRERMKVEGFRVGTFLLYPRAEDHAVLRLANAGFYYTGRGDTLACFCCDVTFTYADRRPDEDPYDIHRQLNPNCPHLMGGETRNVFIQDEQTHATSGRDITGSDSQPLGVAQLVSEVRQSIDQALSRLCDSLQSQSRLMPEDFSTTGVSHQSRRCGHDRNRTNTAGFAAATSNDLHGNGTTGNISNRQQPERETANRIPSPQLPPRTASNTERPSAGHEAGDPSVSEGLQAPTASSETVYNPERALHPHYTNLGQREKSFRQWSNNDVQSPRELALAGFFFTGIGDCVRCHYCGLGLKHWDPDDRPLDEHMRWRSTCGFLRALCGEEFILRTLQRLGSRSREGAVDLTKSAAAEGARAMGFSNDVIQRALITLLSSRAGPRAITTQNLINVIVHLQARDEDSDKGEDEGPPSIGETEERSSGDTAPQATPDQPPLNESPPPDQISRQTLRQLEQENQELTQRRRCKVCLDNDINILFLPCGHLVCCAECARKLNEEPCPVCRKNIISTIDTMN